MSNFNNFSNPHRYGLEKGSKKYHCPECDKKTFVRYIDNLTGEYLPVRYGRCDRESMCLYHINPYLDGYAKLIWEQEQKVTGVTKVTVPKQKYFRSQPKPQPTPDPVFFDFDTFKQTLASERYEKNTFIQNLFYRVQVQFPFEIEDVKNVISLYYLGTVANGYRSGAITFPFIDKAGNVRAIQVKQFNHSNHTTGTDFLHSIIEKHHTRNNTPLPEWLTAYIQQDKRVSCLFGEHLLSKYPFNPVALVEAPKTAVYGTLYFGLPETPESLIWLAVYNKSSFSFDKLKALQGRDVFTFPDLSKDGNTFNEWQQKANEFEKQLPGTHFVFSDLLEQLAPDTDKASGKDIADYLTKQDWRIYRQRTIINKPKTIAPRPVPVKSIIPEKCEDLNFKPVPKRIQPGGWENDINELEKFFNELPIPTQPIRPNQFSTITDPGKFISSHLARVKANNGNNTFLPYLDGLKEFKNVLANVP